MRIRALAPLAPAIFTLAGCGGGSGGSDAGTNGGTDIGFARDSGRRDVAALDEGPPADEDAAADAGDAAAADRGADAGPSDTGTSLSITTQALPIASATAPYSTHINAAGGTPPYRFQLAAGTLPAGLELLPSGVLDGTPTASGMSAFSVAASDSAMPAQTASAAFSLMVRPPMSGMLELATASLPNGVVGATYTATLAAVGGRRPYFWSLGGGALPPGITFTPTGVLQGRPTTPGIYAFTVHIVDISSPSMSLDADLAIDVLESSDSLQITTVSLTGGVLSMPYSAMLAASGGTPPYTFTIAAGVLPAGLALQPTGAITGTPLDLGTFRVIAEVTDSGMPRGMALRQVSIDIAAPPLAITTTAFPFGIVGTTYSATVGLSGGVPPFSFALMQGSLPSGLTLDSALGTLRGRPLAQGTNAFTVRVADSEETPSIVTQAYMVTIYPPRSTVTLTTSALADAVTGHLYTLQFTAAGGWMPYRWSVASGALPPGLALDADGTLHGTPTQQGTYTVTVQVADAMSPAQTTSAPFTIRVFTPLAASAPSPVPVAITSTPYSATIGASGGLGPYAFRVSSGMLPAGLSLSSSGVISGTPTGAGTFGFAVTVSDQAVPAQSVVLSLSINVLGQLQIGTTSLPAGTVGIGYSTTPAASGGTPPYSWFIQSGALPNGLNIDPASGRIFGTPASSGLVAFTLGVADSGMPPQGAFANLTVNVAPPPIALRLTTSSLPGAVTGVAYATPLSALGGDPPYAWSIAAGQLPAGLSIDPIAGAISGTPTAPSTASFTARVTDAEIPAAASNAMLSIAVTNPLSVTTASLPSGVVGTAYSATFHGTGGTTPYVWSISGGSLPGGVTLDSASGILSGTPIAPGTFSFTVSLTDASNPQLQASTSLSITVAALLQIQTASLPNGTVGAGYSNAVQAAGGTTPYAFSVSAGSIPPGLSLDGSSGHVSGTPSATGRYTFTVSVSDQSTPVQTVTQQYMVDINGAGTLTITTGTLPAAVNGASYSTTLQATGGTAPYTWAISAMTLPPGLALNAATGAITGTPTMNGTYQFTVQVVDQSVPQATATLLETIVIAAPLSITTSNPPGGVLQRAYASAFAATGGTTPYNWSITAGALPPGVLLDARSGQLTGAPSMTGTFAFTVQNVDSAVPPQTATRMLQIVVTDALAISTQGLPLGSINSMYSLTWAATGGTTPYTWTVTAGALPPGLTLTPAGVLSGTPTMNGMFGFTVQASDSSAPAQMVNRANNLVITGPLTVTTTSLPTGSTGVVYNNAVTAAGGLAPYQWALASGTLPPGIGLNISGNLQGTPTMAGTFNFTVQATDGSMPPKTATQMLALQVTDSGFAITTSNLNTAVNAQAYSMTMAATGGTMPYTWSIINGILPMGITFSSAGVFSGSTTTQGNFAITIQAQDASTPRITANRAYALAVVAPVAVQTAALIDGVVGRAYGGNLNATGGTIPYTWSTSAGSLPPGITITAMTGALGGTPSTAGTYMFTVAATDSSIPPLVGNRMLSIRVNTPLAIMAMALPNGMVNTAYSAGENATGGVLPYTWTVGQGTLPPGLSIDAPSGIISGTPTQAGLYTFTLRVVDSSNPMQQATVNLNLRVN